MGQNPENYLNFTHLWKIYMLEIFQWEFSMNEVDHPIKIQKKLKPLKGVLNKINGVKSLGKLDGDQVDNLWNWIERPILNNFSWLRTQMLQIPRREGI